MSECEISPSGILPFLRWAGGKRWLASRLAPILKEVLETTNGTYWEPFLGSGAMFFALAPQKAVLSDLNEELIDTYRWVRDAPGRLITLIKQWPIDVSTYKLIRSQHKLIGIERSARFLYLNRTCYGGLHRTNRHGEFNTPFGGGSRTPEPLWRDHLLVRAACYLRSNIELECRDYQASLEKAIPGDVVYCDPTYSDVRRGQFDRYGALIFSWVDQERLAQTAYNAFQRGVVVLVSNGAFPDLHALYPAAYRLCLRKPKTIGRSARSAHVHQEYLLILDPNGRKHTWERISLVENQRSFSLPQVDTTLVQPTRHTVRNQM